MGTSGTFITPEELARAIGSPDAPQIFDVRRRQAFEESKRVIAGATWRDHKNTSSWGADLSGDQELVVYCIHGHQVSQTAAAVLQSLGRRARCLAGGIEAFQAKGGVTVARAPFLHASSSASVWVMAERPDIHRQASAWFIRRFLDRAATFLCVSPERVGEVAEELEAVCLEETDAGKSFQGGRGCLDRLLAEFDTEDEALNHLARIVRGTNGVDFDGEPEGSGLLALSLGILARHRDDQKVLLHGISLFDALYAWARGRESHLAVTPHTIEA